MATDPEVTTAELLSRLHESWESLQAFIQPLTDDQLVQRTDAAGWTVKDHLMHLAVWEDGFLAVLDGDDRRERMGVAPEVWHPETWATEGFDDLNGAIQQLHRDKPLSDVLAMLETIHQRLVAKVEAFSDADLMRPYKDFAPASTSDSPVIWSIVGNSYGHYGDHIPWMDAIAYGKDHEILSKDELLPAIDAGWNKLNAYIDSLTEEQITQPTDAAGWTVKDHLIHLAIWEDSINALLDKESRAERMGVDQATWDGRDINAINAVIQQKNKDLPLEEVRQKLHDVHEMLLGKLQRLYDWDMQRPFRVYQPGATHDKRVMDWIVGDTFAHYAQHMPWMQAIVEGEYHERMSKAELLTAINAGWDDFSAYWESLSDEQLTIPADPAGWTAKDHVAHLAIWEDSINALFAKTPRWEHMGIDRDLWDSQDWDPINAIIQQRYHDIPRDDLRRMWSDIHQRLVGTITSFSDADLLRPYREFQPDSTLDIPVIYWAVIDTYPHYDEHKTYIDVIVNGQA